LESAHIDKQVVAEVRAAKLPESWEWSIFMGVEEIVTLLEGLNCTVSCLDEGSLFYAGEPVLTIKGRYLDFAVFETALLGLVCQSSGIATKAARCKLAAEGRPVYSFGARRMHPSIAPMIERSAYIGGCSGVAVVASANLIEQPPVGTMSHSLMLTVGDDQKAWVLFDQYLSKDIKRILLIDTFGDEKFAAIKAAKTLGRKLFAVRLDTPSSRRGDFPAILREVRWELDSRGYDYVKLFLSGGLDEQTIRQCNPYADAYGVGTSISNARVVDFSMDIVEVEGQPLAKRGKKSGRKQLLICSKCQSRWVVPRQADYHCPNCNNLGEPQLNQKIVNGELVAKLPKPVEIRDYVLQQLKGFELSE
jgi:nicotinate phosphoribosyltransferase